MPAAKIKARFIEPVLLQRTETLSEGDAWSYELKLDGFRAVLSRSLAASICGRARIKDFNARYPSIVQALAAMPDETVIDGEIVALDEAGRPSFSALQNHAAASAIYYAFDVMIVAGKDVMNEPISAVPPRNAIDLYVSSLAGLRHAKTKFLDAIFTAYSFFEIFEAR